LPQWTIAEPIGAALAGRSLVRPPAPGAQLARTRGKCRGLEKLLEEKRSRLAVACLCTCELVLGVVDSPRYVNEPDLLRERTRPFIFTRFAGRRAPWTTSASRSMIQLCSMSSWVRRTMSRASFVDAYIVLNSF
jgi:hypothetical protein